MESNNPGNSSEVPGSQKLKKQFMDPIRPLFIGENNFNEEDRK